MKALCIAAALLAGLIVQAAAAKAGECPAPAAAPTPAQISQAAQRARDRGFLWRVTKGDHSSYLYGTLHLGTLATSMPGPAVSGALQASDLLALELDLADPDIQSRLADSLQASARPGLLPAPLAARLHSQLAAACLGAAAQSLPPVLQITQLGALAARRDGLDAGYGVDNRLGLAARGAGQPVMSLETPEAQVALLTDFSVDEERQIVARGLDDLESGRMRRLLKRTAAIWAGSRLAELESYPRWCDCLRDDGERHYMARVLDERNRAMAAKVAALHDEGRRLFVAIGSLHMIGPNGLPALLQRSGYTIERMLPRAEQNR